MAHYDFKSLSHQDFEELTRDLLQAEWNVSIEAFKTGRDQGIDLRYSRANSNTWIIQCKHYASSSFSQLLADLKHKELAKVQRLELDRYFLVTSLGLTPSNKDKIVETMNPFIHSVSDVFGADDLNGLLSRHSSVEKTNFKLWLTNTEVLERIFHNAEECQTQFEVDRISKKLPILVQSQAYARAMQILDDERIVIISGEPGIGKTTLAEMLLFAHLDKGYNPVVIQTDLSEGKRLFRSERKQIFYYDDFLGQTFLGDHRTYTGRNHDAALLAFIEMIRSTPSSRFVLTTREHILQQAVQISERFRYNMASAYKCILDLKDYSFGQRARILYNHLYFSDLPKDYKKAILKDDFFLSIIKHSHFNPRLIEWLSSLKRLNSPPAEKYVNHITTLLESPEYIWDHAFRSQISDSARDLLLTLYSLGERCKVDNLEYSFQVMHEGVCKRYNRQRNADDFKTALKELDGSFLRYSKGNVSFLNPSIRDFTASVLCNTPSLSLDLINNATLFKQLSNLWKLSLEPGGSRLKTCLRQDSTILYLSAVRLVNSKPTRWVATPEGQIGYSVDIDKELQLGWIVEWAEKFKDKAYVDLAHAYAYALFLHWNSNHIEFRTTISVLNTMKVSSWFMERGGIDIYRLVLDGLLSHINHAWATDWSYLLELPELALNWTKADEQLLKEGLSYYQRNGLDSERDSCSDVCDMNQLKDALKELDDKYQIGFTSTILSLEAQIIEMEEQEAIQGDDDSSGFSHTSVSASIESTTDDDVREMFQTLYH